MPAKKEAPGRRDTTGRPESTTQPPPGGERACFQEGWWKDGSLSPQEDDGKAQAQAWRGGQSRWGGAAKVALPFIPPGAANVRFGSKADILSWVIDVRFTPKSGHAAVRIEAHLHFRSDRQPDSHPPAALTFAGLRQQVQLSAMSYGLSSSWLRS